MSVLGTASESVLGGYLQLFAGTEIFIFVFMEIVSKVETIQRVVFKKARLLDNIIFILVFGLFSIFGSYVGIPGSYGAITNIRDVAPIVAGLLAGPYVGLAVGLIGGIDRLFLGGESYVACSLATVLAGLLAGMVHRLNKGRLIGPVSAMAFGAGIELLHGGLVLLLVRPFTDAVEIVRTSIPEMFIAVALGVGIGVVIFHDVIKVEGPKIDGHSTPE
ncbi:MAG: LytS/YhcK type 5TM receptor domain-containing protein [Halobacteriota archaeon]|jgi:sigma-B regulation protein RsbU (phosphoserine phosphatase)